MRLAGPRLAIPVKLALVASLLLLIPWVGYKYVRELERLLLRVQEQGLVSTARAVATALNDRPNVLLAGEVYSVPASFERDLRVANLEKPIVVDGRISDWDQPGGEPHVEAAPAIAGEPPFSYRYRIGRHGTGVYALFEVDDEHVVLRDPERPELGASDHIQIAVVTADDEFLRFAIDARGDGPISAWLVLEDGSRVPDNRIIGTWRATAAGFLVELRLPRTLIGPRLSFAVVDVDDPETRTLVGQLGTAGGTATREQLGTVLVPSPEISELIRGLGRASSRIWVLDVNRRVLAHAGSLRRPAQAPPAEASTLGPPRRRLDPAAHAAAARRAARGLRGRGAGDLHAGRARGGERPRRPRGHALAPHSRLARRRALGRAPRLRGRAGPRRGARRADDERRAGGAQPRVREAVRRDPGGQPARRARAARLRLAPLVAGPPPA